MDKPSPGALTGLLILALLYTLTLTSEIVLPVLVASLLALILGPVCARLRRLGMPRGLAAGLVTVLVIGGLGWGLTILATPAAAWLERAPQSFSQIEQKLRPVKKPVEDVQRATRQVERLAGNGGTVTVKKFDLAEIFVVSVGQLVAQTLVVTVLTYFLLASGERMIRRFTRIPRTHAGRMRVVAVARRIKADLGIYLGMVTLVNFGLGMVTALVMWALGVPNPALWGALATLLNYIPYAGAMLNVVILAVVGLLSFDETWRGLLPAAAFLALTTVESDFFTPIVVGRRLTLPPMMVFLSLLVWGWMWGVAGALLAVPLLVILKVVADNSEALRPLAPFLGGGVGNKLDRRYSKDKAE